MACLLRSPAIRRALSAASSAGPQGASFRRASSAPTAFGGEGGVTALCGRALSTVPRRDLCAPPPPAGDPANPPSDQLDALYELVRATKVSSLTNDILTRFVESSSNARREFIQKELQKKWMICAAAVGGFYFGCLTGAMKMEKAQEGS